VAKRLSTEIPNCYYPNQYDNLSNRQAHYESTGPEIWEQTEGKITHFVVGVGTGGTITGTAKFLKEKNPGVKIWGVDTFGSVFKKYHETGIFDKIYPYITEGIGEDILPKNVGFELIDHFEKVTDRDGALMARELVMKEGIFVGYSGGSAIAALLQMKDKLKASDLVVVLFHDHGTRYLNKIYNDDWMRDRGFLSKEKARVRDLITAKKIGPAKWIEANTTIEKVVSFFIDNDISQAPVMEGSRQVGSINDVQLYAALVKNPDLKEGQASKIMQKPFPFVDLDDTIRDVSEKINRDNSAVLAQDTSGLNYIITKQDVINALI
jgi:cystathionine beta-synthase